MKLVIWGAGQVGRNVALSLRHDAELIAFIDKNPAVQGQTLGNIPIYSPHELQKLEHDILIIANTHGASIKEFLHSQGYTKPVYDYLVEGLLDPRLNALRGLSLELIANEVPGEIAEAGVYKGDFTRYINRAFRKKKLYLFDTFTGFDRKDIEVDQLLDLSYTDQDMFADTNAHTVLGTLEARNQIILKKGRFPETTTDMLHETFCLVSIDFDLYTPTLDALDYFYPRLSPGGYILIHDYYNPQFLGVKKAVDERKSALHYGYFPLADGGGSVVLCKAH